MSKIKNIIIFIVIGAVFVLIYFFFIKKSPETTTLISSAPSIVLPGPTNFSGINTPGQDSSVAQNFLSLLLSVKNIKLNDAIFSDNVFQSLHDSSITLIPDEDEGRPNPFAPFGAENATTPLTP